MALACLLQNQDRKTAALMNAACSQQQVLAVMCALLTLTHDKLCLPVQTILHTWSKSS